MTLHGGAFEIKVGKDIKQPSLGLEAAENLNWNEEDIEIEWWKRTLLASTT